MELLFFISQYYLHYPTTECAAEGVIPAYYGLSYKKIRAKTAKGKGLLLAYDTQRASAVLFFNEGENKVKMVIATLSEDDQQLLLEVAFDEEILPKQVS